ncbi:MAG: hypothetical protein HY672_04095 [Chloroflexi bacterium]|nr:hypothetical protein [Chloroflexota bacterium]
MRTLSTSLLAAQKAASRAPYLQVEVSDRIGGVARLSWSRLYTGAEPDYHHAATMPGDGSLNRARVSPSDNTLYRQRVASPGPGSDFSQWTSVATVSSVSGIALCSRGASVLLFYVASDQVSIYSVESSNYGATFGSPILVDTAPGAVGWMATDINPSGVVALFYTVGSTLYVIQRTAGTWGSPSAWSNSLASFSGIGCCYQLDWDLAVTGQEASGEYGLWTCVYGDGYSRPAGSWSSLKDLMLAESGADVEFRCPFVGFLDVFRAFFVEKYSGIDAYSRPLWSYSLATADFIDSWWREPVPFNLASSYGMALAKGSSYAWLSTPSGVWRASLSSATLDVSQDVLELESQARPEGGRVRIVLRNDTGRYNSPGSGSLAAIKSGAEVWVRPGYITSAGAEVAPGQAYWVEGWEHLSQGGQALFVLEARDGWGLLEGWRARRQFSWTAGQKNIYQLLAFIAALTGLEYSTLSYSSTLVNHYPTFTIHPRERGDEIVRRLLQMAPDILFFRGQFAYSKHPQASDATDYSYGGDHVLLEGRYVKAMPKVNRAQAYGSGVVSEAFSWTDIEEAYDFLSQVHDLNLTSSALAQDRASLEIRRGGMGAVSGELRVPVNCGQELYDVVAITDSRAGLQAEKRRVVGMSLSFTCQGRKPIYEHRLLLGGV